MLLHAHNASSLVLPLLALAACSASSECSTYLRTSVAQMRASGGSGCFELSHVVVIARTPSATTPRVYAQDREGGNYSAIRAKCDLGETHPCPATTVASLRALIDGSVVTLRGYYLQGSVSGFEEIYLDEAADEGAVAALPPEAALSIADLTPAARARDAWFQIVTSSVPAADPLILYDRSPSALALAGTCPAWSGFAVIPISAGAPTAADCAASRNPRGLEHPDSREILIGREFFKEFFASGDCACAAASKQHLLTATSSVTGTVRGVLIPELTGASVVSQVFHPLSRTDFPITDG